MSWSQHGSKGMAVDKSAYVRMQLGQAAELEEWGSERGLVRLSTVTRLELGFPARSAQAARKAFAMPPLSLMPLEFLTPTLEERAWEVQMLLADRGQHRAPSIPDLLIAATAERLGLTVLAVDKDFDPISEVTKQPVEQLGLSSP